MPTNVNAGVKRAAKRIVNTVTDQKINVKLLQFETLHGSTAVQLQMDLL